MTLRTVLRTSIVALLTVLALAASLAASAHTATPPVDHEVHHDGTPTPTETPTMPGMGAATPRMGGMMQMGEFDLMFIDMMIQHHEGALAMAEVAIERGEHPEVIEMAELIIAAQEEEIAQLEAWRTAWYPDAPEMPMEDIMGSMDAMMAGMPGMQEMMGMAGMMVMMDPEAAAQALRDAPEPFDLAFLNAMIPHHLSAVMMAEMAVQQASHPEVAEAAQVMIDMQEGEIQAMRAWRAAWYGIPATPAF
jgi:uncharacterized protein (DUF305 family)